MLSCAAPLRKVTLLPGDGVGPELCQHVKDVVKHTGAPIEFEEFWFSECNPINSASVEQVTASFNTNKVGLKGWDLSKDGAVLLAFAPLLTIHIENLFRYWVDYA